MEEMVYQNERICKLLHLGKYQDYEYFILSLGTHPTAYIDLGPAKFLEIGERKIGETVVGYELKTFSTGDIFVHGGITYERYGLKDDEGPLVSDMNFVIGWDYAHLGDQFGKSTIMGTKYTTDMILEEVKSVIQQLGYRERGE